MYSEFTHVHFLHVKITIFNALGLRFIPSNTGGLIRQVSLFINGAPTLSPIKKKKISDIEIKHTYSTVS